MLHDLFVTVDLLCVEDKNRLAVHEVRYSISNMGKDEGIQAGLPVLNVSTYLSAT